MKQHMINWTRVKTPQNSVIGPWADCFCLWDNNLECGTTSLSIHKQAYVVVSLSGTVLKNRITGVTDCHFREVAKAVSEQLGCAYNQYIPNLPVSLTYDEETQAA